MLKRAAAALAVTVTLAGPAFADPARALADLLRLPEVVAIMRDEGLAHGETLDADMLNGGGGAFWRDEVSRIYDAGRMARHLTDALGDTMSADDIAQTTAFFETDRGARILTLEVAARRAMSDPAVEEAALAAHATLAGTDDPLLAATRRFVEVNDLIERNVAGTMSSNLAFYLGLADGGALEMDESMMMADIRGREDTLRADTTGWLYGFLLMAYRPLEPADLDAYVAFSETPAGEALNAALFEGFDTMFRQVSYEMGLGVGRAMTATEL